VQLPDADLLQRSGKMWKAPPMAARKAEDESSVESSGDEGDDDDDDARLIGRCQQTLLVYQLEFASSLDLFQISGN